MSETPNSGEPVREHTSLEEASADGPLPHLDQENDAADRAEEDSDTVDPDAEAEQIGRGDLPGGIAMH